MPGRDFRISLAFDSISQIESVIPEVGAALNSKSTWKYRKRKALKPGKDHFPQDKQSWRKRTRLTALVNAAGPERALAAGCLSLTKVPGLHWGSRLLELAKTAVRVRVDPNASER
jgi:hypothetical protein